MQHQIQSAIFWADKAVDLSDGDVNDVYFLAHCYYLNKEFYRAAHLMDSWKSTHADKRCCYLGALCLFESGDPQGALNILDASFITPSSSRSLKIMPRLNSSWRVLRGKCLEAIGNKDAGVQEYKVALQEDVTCIDALQALMASRHLTPDQGSSRSHPLWSSCDHVFSWFPSPSEQDLIESLDMKKCFGTALGDMGESLYLVELSRHGKQNKEENKGDGMPPPLLSVPSSLQPLFDKGNIDLKTILAARLFHHAHPAQALELTQQVLKKDPYHMGVLPIHIACLVELKKSPDLFYLAHQLVDQFPTQAESWRYLQKTTSMKKSLGEAWLLYGHAFASESEHDQAMAAYFKAYQSMKGCHLPLLYVGLEYGLTNAPRMAESFFKQALDIAPWDPYALSEMGSIAFHSGQHEKAERLLREALVQVEASCEKHPIPDTWEPLFNNLGHVYRKLVKYDEALQYHSKALLLRPRNASTLSAIGFIHALKGEMNEAIEYLHRALGLRPDDTFSTSLLNTCLEIVLASDSL
ncbi:unnamed protein product, partial [Darwinula stevensoni]